MMKELSEISWKVTEPEYRKDPALSYSTISKFERSGFSSLPTLFDQVSSPSLTFGSLVDELITGNEDSFNARFIVAEFPKLKPAEETAVKALHDAYGKSHRDIPGIDEDDILLVLDGCSYYTNRKRDTRLSAIKDSQECCDYYRLLSVSDKEVINQVTYDEAVACADELRSNIATRNYFKKNAEGSHIKRYYQLKFKSLINGVMYRCMADLLVVDYEKKVIIPVDLKTSSSREYEFCHSFLKWRYDLQARLYWRIIRQCLDADEYFRDFKLLDWRFIVINKVSRTPLVWGFSETQKDGEITLGDTVLRAPWDIGAELQQYLDETPALPYDVYQTKVNDITTWITAHR